MTAIIPARALSELARIATDGEQTVTMIIPPGRGQVLFHLKEAELVSQLIDGNFPITRPLCAQLQDGHHPFHPQLLKACKQAEYIAREGNYVVRLNVSPGSDQQPGQVEISAQSEETGSSEIKVDATVDGPGLVIAFNVRFLREVLDVIKSPNVTLQTNANNTPGLVLPVGDDSFLHVIMPMHLG